MKHAVLGTILLVTLLVILLVGFIADGRAEPLVVTDEEPVFVHEGVEAHAWGPKLIRPSARALELTRWAAGVSGGDAWTPEGGILRWVEAALIATEDPREETLLVAQALAEGGFARDVIGGACNTPDWMRAHCTEYGCDTGYSCDGGHAWGPFQVHPDQPMVYKAHMTAKDLLDPDKSTPLVLEMLRHHPGAWTTAARARAIALGAPRP